jgi:Lrp/AsnC ligand binding domain/ParB/Sulfiredoxin domain
MKKWLGRLTNGRGTDPGANTVKSFKENQKKEEAFDYRDRGIQTVPLDRIVGSVGRYHDFDSRFRPKEHVDSERLEKIRAAVRSGVSLRPVDLYQIKDEYYVLDGNHRISVAKEFGFQDIDARIIEFIPSKETLDNVIYRERADFNDKTRLSQAIDLTEMGQYVRLLDQIDKHRQYLAQEQLTPISLEQAARDWYKTIYRPLTAIIQNGKLLDSFPGRAIGDLYVYISFHQWEKRGARKYGIGINDLVADDMEEFRKKMSTLEECEYPEMERGIIIFVLMHVKASREYRIIEKLFALDEVQEVHSVHGDVDVIAKISLKRDLVSSDAEVISEFVHNKIRKMAGVVSTETLIPGYSKVKSQPRRP